MRLLDFQGFRPRPWKIWTHLARHLLPRLLPREHRYPGRIACALLPDDDQQSWAPAASAERPGALDVVGAYKWLEISEISARSRLTHLGGSLPQREGAATSGRQRRAPGRSAKTV